jgi:hypothetical protein
MNGLSAFLMMVNLVSIPADVAPCWHTNVRAILTHFFYQSEAKTIVFVAI